MPGKLIKEHPKYGDKMYDGMPVVRDREPRTNWLRHYDALFLICKGEDVKITIEKILP